MNGAATNSASMNGSGDETVHLVVGPDEHGVVLHGRQIAQACGHRVLRVRPGEPWPDLVGVGVVHVPFTDRLFAPDLGAAAARFEALREHVSASGAVLSVTLHDVPHDDSPLQVRRRKLYHEVVAASRGVVVNSALELSLVEPWCGSVHSLRLARLPVGGLATPTLNPGPPAPHSTDAPTVAVLGFVYPDRGYEDVSAAAPPHARLVALGRASEGHEDLARRYAEPAGGGWSITGYLPDDELAARLHDVDVAIAPNRRITASGSVNTWIAHGRRPLVPESPYGRELSVDRPGAVTLYDPDHPDGLRRAIVAALADPASTRLGDDVYRGPSVGDVAAVYRDHLAACVPDAPIAVGAGWVVPGNRWDLLAGLTPDAPRVSVVIPYYDTQDQLDRTLTALAHQTLPSGETLPCGEYEIIVADDGSSQTPDVWAAGDVAARVIRQDDHGFRAAAARNLGAAAAGGDVLVFLDADTVPEPEFLARLSRLPALCPDAVTVGRRRHADFAVDPLCPLPEPGWLRDAYAASSDLLHSDGRSYRFVISAVLGMSRRLFVELGGFDERFVGYGGEDWELAHRAWVAGAVFAHVPDAVAWHDGPDWSARPEASRPGAKDAETFALSLLLPDPVERGGGQWLPYPAVVVRVGSTSAADLLATARSAFATGADVGIWADELTGAHAELVLADARLHRGTPPADVLARARCVVGLSSPNVDLTTLTDVCAAAERHGEVVAPALRAYSTHARNRAQRWWPGDTDTQAARLFGRHDRSAPVAGHDAAADLAGVLRRC